MSARRAATFLGVLGALVMSSGIALVATATSADARGPIHKSYVCKYVGTPGEDEVLQTGQNPIWVDNHSLTGKDNSDVNVGDTFSDAQGFSRVIIANTARPKPEPSVERCSSGGEEQQPGDASASATPTQATCTTGPSYTTSVDHATFTSLPAAVAGTTIHLTAEAADNYAFDSGDTVLDIPLTFAAAPTDCGQVLGTTVVSPPKAHVKAKAKVHAAAVTPTVVHAGLTSVSAQDMRGEQGLALMVAGLVMLAGAGGLGLRIRAASRI